MWCLQQQKQQNLMLDHRYQWKIRFIQNYHHSQANIEVDETLTKIQVQKF
jgi:hypothetical protein